MYSCRGIVRDPMWLVLFDIDGTLLRTAGAGRQALDEAFEQVHGWRDATESIYIAGSTDEVILRAIGDKFGGAVDSAAIRRSYVRALERRLEDPRRMEVLPGVLPLLEALRGRATVGLLTGNWSDGAAIKLRAAGLAGRFSFGAFAEDGPDRDSLLPVAVGRAGSGPFRRVMVIGDTPADIACARAGGAFAVAVQTGFADRETLEGHVPDLLLADLATGFHPLLDLIAS